MSDPSAKKDFKDDPDLQVYLPEELRKRWVVIPRFQLGYYLLAALVVGAGLALGIVGWVYRIRWMYWAPVVMFILLRVIPWIFKRKDRRYRAEAMDYSTKARVHESSKP